MKSYVISTLMIALLINSIAAFTEKDLPINKTPGSVIGYIVGYSIFALIVLAINIWSYATYSNSSLFFLI